MDLTIVFTFCVLRPQFCWRTRVHLSISENQNFLQEQEKLRFKLFFFRQTLKSGEDFGRALLMALRLNEPDLVREVLEQIPVKEIELVSQV